MAEKTSHLARGPRVLFSFCEPQCGPLVFFLLPFLKIDSSPRPAARNTPMGICGSRATVPSEPPVELRPSAPARLQPVVNQEPSFPSSSSRPSSRPRSHSSASKHEPTQHGGRSSQDPTPRSRTKSAPQPPQIFGSPSSQDPRPRARSVVQSRKSNRSADSRTGETD